MKNLEVALEITPDLDPALLWLGWYKLESGDTAAAVRFYKDEIERRPKNAELLYRLAGVYERIGHLDSALVAVDELIRRDPGHRDAMMSGVGIALRFGLKDKAEKYLADWLVRHPNDTSVRRALDELRQRTGAPEGEEAEADSAEPVPRGK